MVPQLNVVGTLFLLLLLLKQSVGFKFSIVHNNDMHARYEPIKGNGEKCSKGDDEKGLCFGGFARVATAVAEARAEGSMLYLNAGDTFHGTIWYKYYKGELAADLLNLLNPDAMSLGNHELDDNIAGLVPFLQRVKFPVVCCNWNLQRVPELQSFKNLVRSTIITKLDMKIGIIGYLTPLTKYYVPMNRIDYYKEIPSINNEAQRLLGHGVKIIIALGHSGYEMDQNIALHCPEVDVVIGGHSHTFLYTGTPPANDEPEGKYPTVVIRSNGQRVPILQAYAFTKYMGRINLQFDDEGHLRNFSGNPILLDSAIPLEAEMKNLLEMKRQIDNLDIKEAEKDLTYYLKTILLPEVILTGSRIPEALNFSTLIYICNLFLLILFA